MPARPRSIYVQIPAYRDDELSATLLDLYAKATDPSALRTCVVWQHHSGEQLDRRVHALPGLELVEVDAADSPGCNWARRVSQERWGGEPYTLLLDSHHRFSRAWDTTLLSTYAQLACSGVSKPLLTGYLPAYDPRSPARRQRRPYEIVARGRQPGILTTLTSRPIIGWRGLRDPVLAKFLSLHFVFVAGQFNDELPFDPEIYFFGDEILTGLRAFTHGYAMYHPSSVIGWHCYERRTRVPHWSDHPSWRRQHQASLDKLRAVYLGKVDGLLGSSRTTADYENHIGTPLLAPAA